MNHQFFKVVFFLLVTSGSCFTQSNIHSELCIENLNAISGLNEQFVTFEPKERVVTNYVNPELAPSRYSDDIGALLAIVKEYFSSFLVEKKLTALKVMDVSKTNRIRKVVSGQNKCDIEYELLFDVERAIYISDQTSTEIESFTKKFKYFDNPPIGWEARQNPNTKKVESGYRILAKGTVFLEETDNGWSVTEFRNVNYEIVPGDFETRGMIETQKEQEEKKSLENDEKFIQLLTDGDWKKEDADTVISSPIYYLSQDIPLFDDCDVQLSISNGMTESESFRYDNLKLIETKIASIIQDLNRYGSSDSASYSRNQNQAQIEYEIKNMEVGHLGVTAEGDDKGFMSFIYYNTKINSRLTSPEKLDWDTEIPHSLRTIRTSFHLTKESAFNELLEQIENEIIAEIIQIEPLYLKIKSVKSKKGKKVSGIVLSNPNRNYFKKGEIVLGIYNRKQIKMENGMLSYGLLLSEISYSHVDENGEIICTVDDPKSKKSLKILLDSKDDYVVITR